MTAALRLEVPDLAIDVFEDSFGFYYDPGMCVCYHVCTYTCM
jgi:hypothetical protein